jgi:hypothetical protein
MPTIDKQVSDNVNDGEIREPATFDNAANWQSAGKGRSAANVVSHSFALFSGITIPQFSIIDVCTYIPYFSASIGNPLTRIYFELALNPAVVADYADFFARALTSGIDWDGLPANGEVPSPSLIVPMQELVNAFDLVNSNVQLFHKNDGSANNNYMRAYSRNQWALHAAKLHIEYSAGTPPGRNFLWVDNASPAMCFQRRKGASNRI